MYEKIKEYVMKRHMIEKQDMVIVGVSGGADSMCLLSVLLKLKEEIGFGIAAVHVNHGIRGKEADADEGYVRRFCKDHEVPLMVERADVKGYAKEHRLSLEEAGREVRRRAYHKGMEKYKGTKIALAHHMDDNVETLILNMLRGSGLHGMAGIRPAAGEYIRPLLGVRRREIECWLKKREICFCEDETNREDVYTRNRIRHHVTPYFEQKINQKSVEHLQELAEQMESLSDYVDGRVSELWETAVTAQGEGYLLRLDRVGAKDQPLTPYLIRRALGYAAGREKDIEAVHVRDVQGLLAKQTGKRIDLPYGLCGVRRYDGIYIGKKKEQKKREDFIEVLLCHPGEKKMFRKEQEDFGIRVFAPGEIPDTIEERPYTKWFDYDIIKNDVVLRSRKPGDYLDIDRCGHTQKLKSFFINEKIPKEQREKVPLVADGQQIMWVVGYRQNQRYQVTEDTRRILEIHFKNYRGESNGRDDQSISIRERCE